MGTHPIFESDFDCLTEFVNNVDRANVHRDQARRRPARIGRQDHQAVRAERLQTRGNEIVQARKGTLGDALRRPQVQALLRWACQLHELWANLRDGVGGFERGQNGPHDAGRVEPANHEIGLWFKPEELIAYDSCSAAWIYE